MSILTNLITENSNTTSLYEITQAMGEIAAIKVKQTKNQIEHNTVYFDQIAQVYQAVKVAAMRQNIFSPEQYKRSKNGKTIAVLITANKGLYGAADTELTHFYTKQTKALSCDHLVIGLSGQELLHTDFSFPVFKSYTLDRDLPTETELSELSRIVFPYERVLVFYLHYQSLLSQVPKIAQINPSAQTKNNQPIHLDYIFEPELPKILSFFESQIFGLLLKSCFLEQELAHFGARMVAMNSAQESADQLIQKQKKLIRHERKMIMNRQILETFTSKYHSNHKKTQVDSLLSQISHLSGGSKP